MKKRIWWNVAQLMIGGILLVISYIYVHAHDAEKVNFMSGMTILRDKVRYVVTSFGGKATSKDFAGQQWLIRSFKELQTFMSETHCNTTVSLSELAAKTASLEAMSTSEYVAQNFAYTQFASNVYHELQTCTQKK
jgi:hypothetical protein